MKNKRLFSLSGIGAVLITSFLYLIDSDPPYDDVKATIFEFLIISVFFFGFITFLFFFARFVKRLIKS